jgi:hypothetical protein
LRTTGSPMAATAARFVIVSPLHDSREVVNVAKKNDSNNKMLPAMDPHPQRHVRLMSSPK